MTSSHPGKLVLDRPAEAVARLTIRNADKRNALDHEILDAIADRDAASSTTASRRAA